MRKTEKIVAILALLLAVIAAGVIAVFMGLQQPAGSSETKAGGETAGRYTDDATDEGDKTAAPQETTGANDGGTQPATEEVKEPSVVWESGGMKISAYLMASWSDGEKTMYQYDLIIENVSGEDVESWAIDVNFNGPYTLESGWNGNYTADGDTVLHITSMDYNGEVQNGDTVENIGFIVRGSEIKG